ncbi:Hypothetical predicted protein [Olea europaea subsp. europaea]|uniref:J domain-containing protein n=1 Tax=Olea europaea subsp. europaea TaxID=158383 RepID=A0A8S0QZF8_OLEEU|nr:Hypothetical predicted protein [Olea europaea subsp. europaea]
MGKNDFEGARKFALKAQNLYPKLENITQRLAFVLHPDKNRFPGAEAAFKLIVEANLVLSRPVKRYSFDRRSRFSNPSFKKQYEVLRKIQRSSHDKSLI